ncbi:MAG: OB-fold nucleic acid binding domain-containing protein, partial [Patescibacteria group bacterium]
MSYIDDPVQSLPLVGPAYARRLEKLEIRSIRNLLEHAPHRYLDFSLTSDIARARVGETVTVKGQIVSFKNQYTRMGRPMQMLTISDSTGQLEAIWFNQPYLSRVFREGDTVSLGGKLDFFG